MAAALAVYVLSGDLAWVPNGHRNLRCLRMLRMSLTSPTVSCSANNGKHSCILSVRPNYQYRLWVPPLGELALRAASGRWTYREAWVLSDRTDHQSLVANGPLKADAWQVMDCPRTADGEAVFRFRRFPLLSSSRRARDALRTSPSQ